MTLSLNPQNSTPRPEKLNLLVHHDEYDKPESGATLRIGFESVHLTGEETIRLGRFLAGGHAALDAETPPVL
jgi:hypothetical protein